MENNKKISNIAFIGSKRSGLELLKIIHNFTKNVSVITFDDSADIRSNLNEFQQYAISENLPFYIAKNKKFFERILYELKPDICFVMGWYWIISEEILNSVPNGFIGIHYSLLPKYRGFSPLIWAIINGEKESGYSIFSLNKGMDEGDIWLQKKIAIPQTAYINEIMELFEKDALNSFKELLPGIINGSAKPYPQENIQPSYCKKRTPEDGKIDWEKNADEIYNFIRAQTAPYPGAFFFYNGKKITLNKASQYKGEFKISSSDEPGKIIYKKENGVIVLCGANSLLLIEEINIDGVTKNPNKVFTDLNLILS